MYSGEADPEEDYSFSLSEDSSVPTCITTANKESMWRRHLDASNMILEEGRGYFLTIRGGGVIYYTSLALDTPIEQAISLLVPHTAPHSDSPGVLDYDLFLLRMTLILLTERVQYLEEERDMVEMQTLLI